MLRELKILRKNHEATNPFLHKLSSHCVHAVSEDNFPTTAERAFTAAGFAALVRHIADLYELLKRLTELPKVARRARGRVADGCSVDMLRGRWDGRWMRAILTRLK